MAKEKNTVNAEAVNAEAIKPDFMAVLKLAVSTFGVQDKLAEVLEELAELDTMPEKLKARYMPKCVEEAVKTAEVSRRELLVTAMFLYPSLTDKQVTELVGGTESGNRSDTPTLRNMLRLFGKLN